MGCRRTRTVSGATATIGEAPPPGWVPGMPVGRPVALSWLRGAVLCKIGSNQGKEGMAASPVARAGNVLNASYHLKSRKTLSVSPCARRLTQTDTTSAHVMWAYGFPCTRRN